MHRAALLTLFLPLTFACETPATWPDAGVRPLADAGLRPRRDGGRRGRDAATPDAGSPPEVDAGARDAGPGGGPRATGDATASPAPACPDADTCVDLAIACPGLADATATLAIREPSVPARGTVVLHGGGGGRRPLGGGFGDAYLREGYRVVDVTWSLDWETSEGLGIKAAACRPATLFRWVAQNLDPEAPTCAHGHSGGGGAIAYALAHYGLEEDLTYAIMSAAPPFGRIDMGCARASFSSIDTALCPELPNAPIEYGPAAAGIDAWMGFAGCTRSSDPESIARWREASVVSDGADYDYGETRVDMFFCTNRPNETTGLGLQYFREIVSEAELHCVAGACSGERAFQEPTAFAEALALVREHCR